MNLRVKPTYVEQKTGGIEEACIRYGVGKGTMREIAETSGAIIRLGKRLLINYSLVDEYLDSISGKSEKKGEN